MYSSLLVRHWDRYETKEKQSLFFAELSKDGRRYTLSKISNVLKGTGLECPIPTVDGSDSFDICHNRIILVAKDPDVDPALNTKCNVYIVKISASNEAAVPVPERFSIPGFEGACTSPVISSDCSRAAFLSMRKNGYHSDKNDIFIVRFDRELQPAKRLLTSRGESENWDRSPSLIRFTTDGNDILAVAEEIGKTKVFQFSADPLAPADVKTLTSFGSINDVVPLANGLVFTSGTTLVDNSFFTILNPRLPPRQMQTWFNSNSDQGSKFGLNPDMVSYIWTPASNPTVNKEIHSIIMKPTTFDSSRKYPVAYIVHGGPQASWKDSWNMKWNLAVFAEQGYVVGPNPTGSTGYGQSFSDDVINNYGGDPYQDIVNCFDWVGENLPWADNGRAVALGASFGGYMINW